MKKTFLIYTLTAVFSACLFSQSVTVQGREIRVNNLKYTIRGVCYNPVAKGDSRFNPLDFSHIDQDIALMTQAKINTIRTYVPITNVTVLDKLAAAGIKVIIGFPNYDDTFQYPDINHNTYVNYINTYKNHAAILMWELGNEYNYHPEWFNNNINNWYTILNTTAADIHSLDPNHPVSTAHGEVPTATVLNLCPNIDVWGMNVYRWDNPSGAISDFAARSTKPCYLSETGGDRYNTTSGIEDQQAQANANLTIWNNIKGNLDICSGVTYFAFVDEWWKSGNNSTHDVTGFSMSIPYDNYASEEWWGIVDIDRNITLAYTALKNAFTEFTAGNSENILSAKYRIYPNPVEDNLLFDPPGDGSYRVQIWKATGEKIYEKDIFSEENINLSALSSGVYFIVIENSQGKIREKFIKK